jgi:short-chain 2-methylacyl-CoA dehydrogenase
MLTPMDFDLSPDHELIRRTVREFAEGEVAPVAEELDRTKSFPYEIVAKLGALNLMGIPFPEEYGGGGGDTLAYALAVEELTRIDSSVAITLCAHTSLGTQPLYLFGTEEQKREWMPRLCAGELLGAFGLTEPEAGSDAGNTRTRARLQDGEWVIDGAKQFITNAGTDISGVVCITAVTGDAAGAEDNGAGREISNIIVANGTPGYTQGEPYRKMGWNASDTRPLSFDDCRVPEENLLGPRGAGFKQFLHILDIASASPRWASGWRRGRSTRRSNTPSSAAPSASRSPSSRRSSQSSPTWPPRSRPHGCSSTRPHARRTPDETSRSRPHRPS